MIRTRRLDLRPASPELVAAALAGPDALADALGVHIPRSWPPEHLDRAALEHTLARLHEDPTAAAWALHFFVLRDQAVLVGGGGYAGAPDRRGVVEIGYSIVAEHQRRGYATEATHGLCRAAFAEPRVTRVIAETLPELSGSIKVLEACGFTRADEASEAGVIRFVLDRGAAGLGEGDAAESTGAAKDG